VTSATGAATISISGDILTLNLNFSGLSSGTTAAHIHCCGPAGTNTGVAMPFPGFPLGVTSGSYSNSFDLTLTATYDPAFLTANGGTAASAEAALLAGLNAGDAYLNIHTTTFLVVKFAASSAWHQRMRFKSSIRRICSLEIPM